MGYLKQKAIEDQQQEMLEDMVKEYLRLFVFFEDALNYEVYEEGNYIVIDFDEDSANDLKSTFTLEEGTKLRVRHQDLEPNFGYYDEDEFDAIISQSETLTKLESSVDKIMKLLEINVDDTEVMNLLYNQSYISAIATLETFLSEKLIGKIFSNSEYRKNFILTHRAFKEMKFELREIFDKTDELDSIIKKLLLDQIYHNLHVVSNIYRATMNIIFPEIGDMMKAVSKRHDLVHRNGKTKEGVDIEIDKEEVEKLCNSIKSFAQEIEDEIEK